MTRRGLFSSFMVWPVVRSLGPLRLGGNQPWFVRWRRWLPEDVFDELAMEYVDQVIHEHRAEEAAKKQALPKRA